MAAPICLSIPELSVYRHIVLGSFWSSGSTLSWYALASFLVPSMCDCIFEVNYSSLMYEYIVSIAFACAGNLIIRFSRFDENVVPVAFLLAFRTRLWSEWLLGSICILVRDRKTLYSSRIPAGSSPVSYSRAAVRVVRKHPVIAFIASRWILVSSVV